MSTRSIIVVTGEHKYNGQQTIRLYKHSDGYPTDTLSLIESALNKSLEQTRLHYSRIKHDSKDESLIGVEQIVGNLIGESTDVYGMGAVIDTFEDDTSQYREAFRPSHLGLQSDLEWIYLVDLNRRTVKVYGGGFTGNVPQVAYKKGTVNPLKYADCLCQEHQERERQKTKELISAIESLGFSVNPKRRRSTGRPSNVVNLRQGGVR